MSNIPEIVVDSFAGGGGASEGIEQALAELSLRGMLNAAEPYVSIAINHDDAALAMHAANHPNTIHLPADIWTVDPRTAVNDAPVGLLWASPDCRHHSKAKGGKPVSKSVRSLANVIAHWAEQVHPRQIYLENVEEFQNWGPLIADENGDLRPDPDRKAELFRRWLNKFRRLGYRIEYRQLRACEYGAPTIRKRLYIIMRCDGDPIVWPGPTHGDPKSEDVKTGKLKPWPVAADIIDWDRPCPSILMGKQEAKQYKVKTGTTIIRPLATNTERRIAKGIKRYVLEAAEPFIVTCNHSGGGFRGQGLDEPFRTVTKARDAHGLVMPHIMTMRNSGKPHTGIDEPTHTVMAGGAGQSLVEAAIAPFVTYGQHGGANRSIDNPLHTVTASRKDTDGVACAFLAQHNTGVVGRRVDEPFPTILSRGTTQALVAAHFLKRDFGRSVGSSMDQPIGTILAGGGGKTQLLSAHMISLKGSSRRAGSVEDPHPTVTSLGQHSGVVSLPLLNAYYGNDKEGAEIDVPLRTISTKDRFGIVDCLAAEPPMTPEQVSGAIRVTDFLRKYDCWDGDGFAKVGPYIIVDIGMRMLTPRELARAQGFDDEYQLAAPQPKKNGKLLTETDQRHKIGNSVCPPVARALVLANYRPQSRETATPPQGWLFEHTSQNTEFLEAAE